MLAARSADSDATEDRMHEIRVALVQKRTIAFRPFERARRVVMIRIVNGVAVTSVLGGIVCLPRVNQHAVIDVEAPREIRQVSDEETTGRVKSPLEFQMRPLLFPRSVR